MENHGIKLFMGTIPGRIPPCIGDLDKLTELWLSDNELTGEPFFLAYRRN